MFEVGQIVKVLEPFSSSFPETYEITEVISYPDGQVAYILGELGGFSEQYLEAAE